MTQEEKDLLIKDLSCRLPYGVKVHAKYIDLGETIEIDGTVVMIDGDGVVGIELMYDTGSAWTYVQIDDVKPYLVPLSSMTEEQYNEMYNYCYNAEREASKFSNGELKIVYNYELIKFDYLNKNNFDYRGLIPKGLANDLTTLNIKTPMVNNPQITIGTKIRSKTNPNVILNIISNDCHGDEFECSNGSVLSLKQIEKYYEII